MCFFFREILTVRVIINVSGGVVEMSYRIQEDLLREYQEGETECAIDEYIETYRSYLYGLSFTYQMKEIKSGYNRMNRHKLWSSEEMNFSVRPGDVCYIDFGHAYKNESGYQHFGLVIQVCNHKILVIPMTSKTSAKKQSRNAVQNGKKHLYYIGLLEGLHKPSTLFLNDFKYLNSSRIISINGRLCTNSEMFKEIHRILKMEML